MFKKKNTITIAEFLELTDIELVMEWKEVKVTYIDKTWKLFTIHQWIIFKEGIIKNVNFKIQPTKKTKRDKKKDLKINKSAILEVQKVFEEMQKSK